MPTVIQNSRGREHSDRSWDAWHKKKKPRQFLEIFRHDTAAASFRTRPAHVANRWAEPVEKVKYKTTAVTFFFSKFRDQISKNVA